MINDKGDPLLGSDAATGLVVLKIGIDIVCSKYKLATHW